MNQCFSLMRATFFNAFHSLYVAGCMQKGSTAGQRFLEALYSSVKDLSVFCQCYKSVKKCWGNEARVFLYHSDHYSSLG